MGRAAIAFRSCSLTFPQMNGQRYIDTIDPVKKEVLVAFILFDAV
jgi:hypothetical protein